MMLMNSQVNYAIFCFIGARPRYGAFYGQGSGPIFLSGLKCTGTESNLLNCSRNVLDAEYCRHYEDAGVACQGTILLLLLLLIYF